MNLIEQLGGYEKVKQMWIDGGSLQGTQLAFELLEYRRQHNIFEAGDLITHPMFKSVFIVDNVFSGYVFAVNKSGYRTKLFTDVIKHTTDAEIKEGRRL